MKPAVRFACLAGAALAVALVGSDLHAQPSGGAEPWRRHTIDRSSRGADGVRLGDADGDGRPDVVTGWEEGGLVRVYLHPGPERVRDAWPAVTVGAAADVEDAVFADLDGDGVPDVVSASEGRTRSLFVHWAPDDPARYLDPRAWRTEPLPAAQDRQAWMFTHPVPNARGGVDLVAGGKLEEAAVGRLQPSGTPRDLAAWSWRPMGPAGWIMSLLPADLDGDGDLDVLLTDRRGPLRGCRWLENPGPEADGGAWPNHFVGGRAHEVMFMAYGDVDGDGLEDIVSATSGRTLLLFRRSAGPGVRWRAAEITLPEKAGLAKSVAVGDLDGDGRMDLVFSCEHARDRSGVMWLSAAPDGSWQPHEISGPAGTKFDLVQLLDLDEDGDLDVLTCEEAEGLGVVWYENPSVRRAAR